MVIYCATYLLHVFGIYRHILNANFVNINLSNFSLVYEQPVITKLNIVLIIINILNIIFYRMCKLLIGTIDTRII